MPSIDFILIMFLGAFILYGFWFGLIHTLGGLVGVVLGSLLAPRFTDPIAAWLVPIIHADPAILRIIAFLIGFILINRLVGFGFWMIERIFKLIAVIPFLKTINRLAGACLGFLEGVFVLGGILFITAQFPAVFKWQTHIKESNTAKYLLTTYSVMTPLLPKGLRDFDTSSYFKK